MNPIMTGMAGNMFGGGQMNPGMMGGVLSSLGGLGMGNFGGGGYSNPYAQQPSGGASSALGRYGSMIGALDGASGGTPMDAGQPAPYLDQGGNQGGGQSGGGFGHFGKMIKNAMGGGFGGGGQQFGPWGSAMRGGMNPGQGQFSSNNMGMFGSSNQQPFGMGNNPMNNFMNPYQGNMFGNMGNPNQRQPFMGGGLLMNQGPGGNNPWENMKAGMGGSQWGNQNGYMRDVYQQGQNNYQNPPLSIEGFRGMGGAY